MKYLPLFACAGNGRKNNEKCFVFCETAEGVIIPSFFVCPPCDFEPHKLLLPPLLTHTQRHPQSSYKNNTNNPKMFVEKK